MRGREGGREGESEREGEREGGGRVRGREKEEKERSKCLTLLTGPTHRGFACRSPPQIHAEDKTIKSCRG